MKKIFCSCALCLLFCNFYTFALEVSGTVKNENGLPLTGITIGIAGSSVFTLSDMQGKYRLTNVPESGAINFMGVGWQALQEKVNNKAIVDVVMRVSEPSSSSSPQAAQNNPAAPKVKGLKHKLQLLLSVGDELVRTASLVKSIKAEFKGAAKIMQQPGVVKAAPVPQKPVEEEDDEEDLTVN